MNNKPIKESADQGIRVLLHFLKSPKKFKALENYLRWDLFTKFNGIKDARIRELYLKKYVAIRETDIADLIMPKENGKYIMEKHSADVVIVTVKIPELTAALVAFDLDPNGIESYIERGMRFWVKNIQARTRAEPLRVVITMAGTQRNIEMAAAMATILSTHNTSLAILVGIAAGLKSKTKLGDVVAAHEMVLDYDSGRAEIDGVKKRPAAYMLETNIKRNLEYFNPLTNWQKDRLEKMNKLSDWREVSDKCATWNPELHKGVILSGSLLLADGSLPVLQKEYSDFVRAAEMEGSGFARLCKEESVPWLVFRGVSDFGDPDKAEWPQIPAAISAATCARAFLHSDYRPPSPSDRDQF